MTTSLTVLLQYLNIILTKLYICVTFNFFYSYYLQTATQHQQPMMNPTLPPTYAYFAYGGGIMPGGFQYGTPAIYPVS